MDRRTFFISGHIDLSASEFNDKYIQKILAALNEGASFVIGDSKGADALAMTFLAGYALKDNSIMDRTTIYHCYDKPRNYIEGFRTEGGFISDSARDEAMTLASDEDILYVRSEEEQRKRLGKKYNPNHVGGTQHNLLRRLSGASHQHKSNFFD
jgi:hypothetical protein